MSRRTSECARVARNRSNILKSALVCSLLVGCSTDGGDAEKTSQTLEIFSWWVEAGEASALQNLLSVFQTRHPAAKVINAAVAGGSANAKAQLDKRLTDRDPPDAFQALPGADLLRWVKLDGRSDSHSILEPLDTAMSSNPLKTLPAAALEGVTVNGHLYGLPLGFERDNVMFYNKTLFSQHGLSVPRSLSEFLDVAAAFKAKGVTPLALGNVEEWPSSFVAWSWVFLAQVGPAYYVDFFKGRKDPRDGALRSMLETYSKVLDYVNADYASTNWDDAAHMVYDGTAAMNVMGDFVKAELVAKGWTPNVEFGALPAPGTQGTFLFVCDTFALPKGAANRKLALDFFATVASKEGQEAFCPAKGTIPVRADVDRSKFDALALETLDDFQRDTPVPSSAIFANAEFDATVTKATSDFIEDRDIERALNLMIAAYPRQAQ